MAPEPPAQGQTLRYFTWDEVAQRSGREKERWLVIERKVYNISEFTRRHPGGSRVISHSAGQDATVSPARLGRGRRRARGSVRETGSLATVAKYQLMGKSWRRLSIPVAQRLGVLWPRDTRAGASVKTSLGSGEWRSAMHTDEQRAARPCVRSFCGRESAVGRP